MVLPNPQKKYIVASTKLLVVTVSEISENLLIRVFNIDGGMIVRLSGGIEDSCWDGTVVGVKEGYTDDNHDGSTDSPGGGGWG